MGKHTVYMKKANEYLEKVKKLERKIRKSDPYILMVN